MEGADLGTTTLILILLLKYGNGSGGSGPGPGAPADPVTTTAPFRSGFSPVFPVGRILPACSHSLSVTRAPERTPPPTAPNLTVQNFNELPEKQKSVST